MLMLKYDIKHNGLTHTLLINGYYLFGFSMADVWNTSNQPAGSMLNNNSIKRRLDYLTYTIQRALLTAVSRKRCYSCSSMTRFAYSCNQDTSQQYSR